MNEVEALLFLDSQPVGTHFIARGIRVMRRTEGGWSTVDNIGRVDTFGSSTLAQFAAHPRFVWVVM